MEIASPGHDPEPLEIEGLRVRDRAISVEEFREGGRLIRARPGWQVYVSTSDARAACPAISVRVPNAVPPVLVVHMPSKDDPRLRSLTLEVVDSASGAPLPDAVWESGGEEQPPRHLHADVAGRIAFADPREEAGDRALPVLRLAASHGYVFAPGHLGFPGRALPVVEWPLKDEWPYVDGDSLDVLLDRGTWLTRLEPLPPAFNDRSVRILDASGRPVAGAVLYVNFPVIWNGPDRRAPWGDGIRRTDGDGVARFPAPSIVGLDAYLSGVLIASWGLSRDAWPPAGPRDLRLPALADVEVVLEGLPETGRVEWMFDPWGSARLPTGGPPLIQAWFDPGVLDALKRQAGQFLPLAHGDGAGVLAPGTSTLRFPLPVGTGKTLHFVFHPEDPEDRQKIESRTLNVRADRLGSLAISRRWANLERER